MITVPKELLNRVILLCQWISETQHQRGSVNGLAAQVMHETQAATDQPEPEPYGWTHSGTFWVEVSPKAREYMEAQAAELGEAFKAFPLYTRPAPAPEPLSVEEVVTSLQTLCQMGLLPDEMECVADWVSAGKLPEPAKPLTDEQIIEIRKNTSGGRFGKPSGEPWGDSLKFARAIEAARNIGVKP